MLAWSIDAGAGDDAAAGGSADRAGILPSDLAGIRRRRWAERAVSISTNRDSTTIRRKPVMGWD